MEHVSSGFHQWPEATVDDWDRVIVILKRARDLSLLQVRWDADDQPGLRRADHRRLLGRREERSDLIYSFLGVGSTTTEMFFGLKVVK